MRERGKWYRYSWYNPYRDERTVGIVFAYSEEQAREMLRRKYGDAANWSIEEFKLTKSEPCTVYYGG